MIVKAVTPTPTAQAVYPVEPLPAATAVSPVFPEPTPNNVRNAVVASVYTPAPTTYYIEDRAAYIEYLKDNVLKGVFTEDSCKGLTVRAFAGEIPACSLADKYEALGAEPNGETVLLYSVGSVPGGEMYWGGFADESGIVYLNIEALRQDSAKAAHEIAHRYCQQKWDDNSEPCANREMQRVFR